jgi:hemoglobin-like flavoprotein
MLAEHPELLRVFNQGNQATGEQSRALAASVVAYAVQLVDPGAPSFAHVLRRIAYKHASLGIRPERYTIVGRNLLAAVGEVLGDAVTPEVAAAWDEVYWLFATQLIAEEARLYQQAQIDAAHPLRPYRWVRRIEETADVASFVLEPADGLPLPEIAAGQYVSVFVDRPDGRRHPRQYTVSSTAFGHRLQITVLRVRGVNGAPDGMVSSYLHDHLQPGDTVEVSAPAGDFVVQPSDIPLLLASAGAGITTVLPIVEEIAAPSPSARSSLRTPTAPPRITHCARPCCTSAVRSTTLLPTPGTRRSKTATRALVRATWISRRCRYPTTSRSSRAARCHLCATHVADRAGGAGESDPVRGVRPGFVGRADPGVRSNRRRSVGRLHRFPGARAVRGPSRAVLGAGRTRLV